MDSPAQSVHLLITRSATATVQIPLWSPEKTIGEERQAEVPGKTNREYNAILKGELLWRTRSQIGSNLARD